MNSTIFMHEFLDVHLLTLEGLDFWAIVCRFHCVEGGNPHSQRNWEFSAPPLCTYVSHTQAHSPYPVTNNRIHSTHKTSICSYRIQTVVGFTTIKEKRIITGHVILWNSFIYIVRKIIDKQYRLTVNHDYKYNLIKMSVSIACY